MVQQQAACDAQGNVVEHDHDGALVAGTGAKGKADARPCRIRQP